LARQAVGRHNVRWSGDEVRSTTGDQLLLLLLLLRRQVQVRVVMCCSFLRGLHKRPSSAAAAATRCDEAQSCVRFDRIVDVESGSD